MEKNMLLYHGSNVEVSNPQILTSDRRLDFGKGFYLTSNFDQAKRWAELTVKRRETGKATVSVFDFDDTSVSDLKILHFSQAQKEWLEYVTMNRKNQIMPHDDYDIVIGPIANAKNKPNTINKQFVIMSLVFNPSSGI